LKAFALVLIFCMSAGAESAVYTTHTKVQATVSSVRSIDPESRVGFGKSLPLYAVDLLTADTRYVAYCTTFAPKEGDAYTAEVEYVSGNFSALRLWPAEKKSIGLSGRGRLYKVITFENAFPASNRPNVACDVYSEAKR
jgi:hypothetical protein